MIQSLILLSIKHIHLQRSQSAIFHLLTGKRSIQTVQDAHLFGLDRFYGVLPLLSRQAFDQHIQSYIQSGEVNNIIKNNVQLLQLTELGNNKLLDRPSTLDHLNGLSFYKTDEIFYKRLLLYVQVLTNHLKNHTSYIPIIEDPDILHWMKQQYNYVKYNIKDHLERLYVDLYSLLNHVSKQEAEIFVDRLTSYQNYGLSLEQISMKLRCSVIDLRLILKAIVHQMLTLITKGHIQTKLLINFISDLPHFNVLTKSAQVTYDLLNKQYSAEQIASLRRLKENTIYDHIVEICWYDQEFSTEQYINKQIIDIVKQSIQTSKSLQLKTIKEMIPDDISYFQIRLALTRIKNIFAESVENYDTNRQS